MAGTSPLLPVSFLHSRHSAKPNFCEMEFYVAAVGDLSLPAIMYSAQL